MKTENIHELIDRFFGGELSADEERALLALLIEHAEGDPEAEEALAVMTCTRMLSADTVGKRSVRPEKPRRRSMAWRGIAAAAGIAIATAGILFLIKSGAAGQPIPESDIAYVDGVRIDNQDEIMKIVAGQLDDLSLASAEIRMEVTGDLDDIRNVLNMDGI